MENTLRIVVGDLSETVETENIEITKESLLDREKLKSLLDSDYEREVNNEYLSEIFQSGKFFNFPYLLNKEKYTEFVKKHKLVSYFGYDDDEEVKSEFLDIEGDVYVRLSIDFIYNDSSYHYGGVEGVILRPELSNYFEGHGWKMDKFMLPLVNDDDADAVIVFINEVLDLLGKPDMEYKEKRMADYKKELAEAQRKINALNSIQ